MSRVASVIPDETDLLCEGCGYTLNGLPASGNCPECGKPIEESLGQHRRRTPFERDPSFYTYARTMGLILSNHRRFFKGLSVLPRTWAAAKFARINLIIASLLFWATAVGHVPWAVAMMRGNGFIRDQALAITITFGWPVIFALMVGLTRLATWLSAIEARYWGMRLPYPVVLRGLQFHSADYLPVGLLAFAIVWGHHFLRVFEIIDRRYEDIYLYTLCGAVVVSAVYLFRTYWIAMRAMMYANR